MNRCALGLAVICVLPYVSGLMCYWCSGVGSDRDCERKPLGIKSGPSNVNCSSKFCTTAKVMDLENGEVKSFARFCDNVYRGNRCVKDTKLMTCYQACVYDHCNNGNPSPKYLRVENLLQPDPDSKRKLSAEVSTDSQFHFFTAPEVSNDQKDKKLANAFKEQSIFKAFTTHKPSTSPPSTTTPTEPPTTTEEITTVLTTETTEGVGKESTKAPDDEQSSDSIPSVSSLIVDSKNTTWFSDTSIGSTDVSTPSTDASSIADYIQLADDPTIDNSMDDLGSEAPVDGPDLPQQDGPPETLSPEPVKEHHRTAEPVSDVKEETKKDVIYTTAKPSSTTGLGDEYDNLTEQNITKTEELNLAATQNATDTSGTTSLQMFCVSLMLFSLLTHVL